MPAPAPYGAAQGKEVAIEAASLRRTISGAKNTVGVYLRKRGEEVMLAHFRGLFGTQELSSYQLALAAKAGEMFDRWARWGRGVPSG